MKKKYAREEIEALIADHADFHHECLMDDRTYENETFKWGTDGSCIISAKKGRKIASEGKDDFHAPYYE